MVSLKHKFTSAKADGGDSTLVKPSDWNDEHDLELSAANRYVGRDQSGAGPAQELPVVPSGLGDDGTIWTGAKVAAAIAAAIAALPPAPGFKVGDIKHTLDNVEEAGYLWLNGDTLGNAASLATGLAAAAAEPLFTFFWNKYSDALCPVLPGGRGADAAADFAVNKTITMLDSRGCTLAAAENMGGTSRGNLGGNPSVGGFPAVASLGQQAGQKAHAQTGTELASHGHGITPGQTHVVSQGLGGNGGGNVGQDQGTPLSITAAGSSVAANVTQPTLACNVLVKY